MMHDTEELGHAKRRRRRVRRLGLSRAFVTRVLPGLILFGILFTGGVAGFRHFEGMSLSDALYLTVVTLSTVGFGDIVAHTPIGRMFTLGLIISGVGFVAYFMGSVTQILVQGEWRSQLEQRMRQKRLDKLRGHAIVCGSGRVGGHVVRELEDGGINCVVIDSDPQKAAQRRATGLPVVEGDATDEEVLRTAGVQRARYLVAAAPTDAENLFITFSARNLNPSLVIVSRANEENSEGKLLSVGANHVVHVYRMTALTMVGMLLTSSKPFDDATDQEESEDSPTEMHAPSVGRASDEKDTIEELAEEDGRL